MSCCLPEFWRISGGMIAGGGGVHVEHGTALGYGRNLDVRGGQIGDAQSLGEARRVDSVARRRRQVFVSGAAFSRRQRGWHDAWHHDGARRVTSYATRTASW